MLIHEQVSHLVDVERGIQVLEASKGGPADRGYKLHQSAALFSAHLRNYLHSNLLHWQSAGPDGGL
jgi:hypothetical protein